MKDMKRSLSFVMTVIVAIVFAAVASAGEKSAPAKADPAKGTVTAPAATAPAKSTPTPTKAPALAAGETVNVNTADAPTLRRLPGVGPALAAAIIEYRTKSGPFVTVDDLLKVKGIGPKRFARIKAHVAVK